MLGVFSLPSTGPKLQFTLKIVTRFHVFLKISYSFYLISSSHKQTKKNP